MWWHPRWFCCMYSGYRILEKLMQHVKICSNGYMNSSPFKVTQSSYHPVITLSPKFAIDNCPITPSAFEGFEHSRSAAARAAVSKSHISAIKGRNLRHVYVPSSLPHLAMFEAQKLGCVMHVTLIYSSAVLFSRLH